ncbi:MAG TPA: type II secretion system protein [Methylotenera sp.]|nr:type II secretion system protein [Methylotenera sp.]HPH04718.1 type II secretion system protein [Methylotenera sp.]HPN01134.1 type II secretion system protein [Methylotenera sp.]
MKTRKYKNGFTLLEIVSVIFILSALSVGALATYESVVDTSQATASVSNTNSAYRAIRSYRSFTAKYPNKWDHLVTDTGASLAFVDTSTYSHLSEINIPVTVTSGDFRDRLDVALASVGVDMLQIRSNASKTQYVVPNLQHNEGSVGVDVSATLVSTVTKFVVASEMLNNGTPCQINGTTITDKLDGTAISSTDVAFLNVVSGDLELSRCDLLLVFGFGHDAANSTTRSKVAISQAPTSVSKVINPAKKYARHIVLFHVASDDNGNNNIEQAELLPNAQMVAIMSADGRFLDQDIAESHRKE